jgi:hypothetical protein
MRDDMDEVIIERPRWGSRMRHVRRAHRVDSKRTTVQDPESLPFRIGLRRSAHGGLRKTLSDNLAPLRRYLMKQVNRPWDKVWSEISANLKATNTVQQHVRDHIGDFVAVRTFVQDGEIWAASAGLFGTPKPLRESRHLLYVDPRTGILRRNKHYKGATQKRREQAAAEARERAQRMRELGPFLQLHLLNDCWWEVTLARKPWVPNGYAFFSDVVIGAGMSRMSDEELYGRWGVYALKKRQLTSAEIVRFGLKT